MRDPRQSRRYTTARALWLATIPRGTACHFCDQPVDTTLSGATPNGPTVEHTLAVIDIMRTAPTYADALTMCLDQRLWRLAHRRCNSVAGASRGGRAVHGTLEPASRDW